MPKIEQIYGITINDYVILNNNTYDYENDDEIMNLIKRYGKIILDDNFNAPIPFVVNGVRELICGRHFNQPLHNLPSTLKVLHIGCLNPSTHYFACFNHLDSLQNLPFGIEEIRLYALGCGIPSEIGLCLPSSIKRLYLMNDKPINMNLLPDSIQEIFVTYFMLSDNKSFDITQIHHLPANLKTFIVNSGYNVSKILNELKDKFPWAEYIIGHEDDFWNRI